MAGYTPNTTAPTTNAFDDSTNLSTGDSTLGGGAPLGSSSLSSGTSGLPGVGETRRDAGNPVSTTVGGDSHHHEGGLGQHHNDNDKDESLTSKMNPFKNSHNEPPSSMITGEYVPGSGKLAGISSGNKESHDLSSGRKVAGAATSANDDPSFLPSAGRDSSNIATTTAGAPSGMNAGGGIAGTGAAHDAMLGKGDKLAPTEGVGAGTSTHHTPGVGSTQGTTGGDSTVGKIMQKAGEMMHNEKMQIKGQEKREQKGYDGPDVASTTTTQSHTKGL